MKDLTPKEPPLTPTLSSAFAVFAIFLFVPLLLGGSIVLASTFGEREVSATTPDDANGFRYPPTEQGSYNSFPTQSVVYSSTVTRYNEVWTPINRCFDNSGGDCAIINKRSTDKTLTLQLPDIFDSDEEIVSILIDWHASVTTTYCTDIDAGMEWSWQLLGKDYRVIAEDDERDETPYIEETSYSSCRNMYSFGKVFTVTELNNLRQNYDDCKSNCTYYLRLTDWGKLSLTGYDNTQFLMVDNGNIRLSVETLDGVKTSVVMTVVPWAISAAMFLVSLASTKLWNPTMGLLLGGENK